jgi:hypothetical protein
MDVATITLPADEARAKFEEYRSALAGREPTEEDRGVMLGYRALARGRALLSLDDVFRACPLDGRGRPRLAVGRAHWRWCHLEARSISDARGGWVRRWAFAQNPRHLWGNGRMGVVAVPLSAVSQVRPTEARWRAVTPLIPPNLRPPEAGLRNYHVLWEAEWEAAPADPMLLRHLHGGLYAVLACWDLTSLERAVLAGRLSEVTP